MIFSGLEKIISPKIFTDLVLLKYSIILGDSVVMMLGALQLSLSLLFILGMSKNFSYSAMAIIQLLSLTFYLSDFAGFLTEGENPFSELSLSIIYIAFFIVRHQDNKWTLSKKNTIFSSY